MFLNLLYEFGCAEDCSYVSIDTQKMIDFISKHGVNVKDCLGSRMLNLTYMMTDEQIDIFFEHKPNLILDNGLPFFPVFTTQNMHIYEKIIECDTQGDYVRKKFSFYNNYKSHTVSEHIEELGRSYSWGHLIPSLEKLLWNHKMKHFTLFEHMTSFLDDNNFNKQQQFQ